MSRLTKSLLAAGALAMAASPVIASASNFAELSAFANDGEEVAVVEAGTGISTGVIIGTILVLGTVFAVVVKKKKSR